MVGPVVGYTPTYNFAKVRYDVVGWSTLEHGNWSQLDALLSLITGLPGVKGVWANSTPYIIGDRTVDAEEGGVYRCLVAHTSAASGTFTADRAANPTYWEVLVSTPLFIGNWVTATAYGIADIVAFNTYDYYYCLEGHTSGVFATDLAAGKWTLIWNASAAVTAAAASAAAAALSETAADASADDAALSAIAATTNGAAAGAAQFDIKILLTSINALSDVDTVTVPPTVGTGLVWDGAKYVPGPAGGGMFKGDAGTVGNRAGDIFRITEQQLDANTTIAATENAHAPGPITIASGITLTISSGGNLVIT